MVSTTRSPEEVGMPEVVDDVPRHLAPWMRLAILLTGLAVLCLLSWSMTGSLFPTDSRQANIFQSGLLLVILGSLFLEDKFTRPADVVVNGLTGIVALMTVVPAGANAWWILVFLYCLAVFLAAAVCIALSSAGEVEPWRAKISDYLYRTSTAFGSSRVLFTVVFLYGVFSYYGLQSKQTATLVLFWGMYIALWPLRIPQLVQALIALGLYVGSMKTHIKESRAVLDSLGEGRHRIEEIEADLQSGTLERMDDAASKLVSFFHEITADGAPLNDRHFRYCINRFKRLRASGLAEHAHDDVRDDVLGRLKSMPDSADVFVDYLSLFPRSPEVQLAVLDFLDGPYNTYPWQEMTLLELLVRADIAPSCLDRTLTVARSFASAGRHPACRAKALTLWGKNGDYADRREIRSGYDREAREDIRRAIVVAIQEMQSSERDNFYREVVSGSRAVGRTAGYIQSLPEPTYHYYKPPPGYELVEDSDDLDDLSDQHLVY
jgi:hypothetical protein